MGIQLKTYMAVMSTTTSTDINTAKTTQTPVTDGRRDGTGAGKFKFEAAVEQQG